MPARLQKVPIDIERIRELVPHAGTMCLLERVIDYSAHSIHCRTRSHADPANPLRRSGHLSSVCGIEYAAQAMALHDALKHSFTTETQAKSSKLGRPRHGYLVSVRQVDCHTRYLDTIAAALDVRADHVFGDASGMVYSFKVNAGEILLITGRASVMLG